VVATAASDAELLAGLTPIVDAAGVPAIGRESSSA
jgi:hypothetical protein